jgi:hypothetical protein
MLSSHLRVQYAFPVYQEDAFRDNAAILAALQERRHAERVKSARGATREHRRTYSDIASLLCVRLCRRLGKQ